MFKVSVIVPNYNHAAYLPQRLDSILNQTYRNFELIILDDCSTDGSRQVIENYRGNSQVTQVIFNEVNTGSAFKQWQKGISVASGKYIWIAESDDWCEPTLLEVLVNAMEEDEACVLGYVQSYVVNAQGNIHKQSSHPVQAEYVNGQAFIQQYMVALNSIFNAGMALFKKECYAQVNLAFTDYKLCGDWLFWAEIAKQGKVFISGQVLNYFRKHSGDITGGMLASGYNFIEENDILKQLLKDKLIDEGTYKQHLLQKYIGYLFNKKRFQQSARQQIEASFFNRGGTSYKSFLKSRGNWFTVFRIKAVRRISKWKGDKK